MSHPPPTPPALSSPSEPSSAPGPDAPPGVPGFRTWRGVYLFVFGVFVLVVAALAWFARAFA
jgi:hypothetical protein